MRVGRVHGERGREGRRGDVRIGLKRRRARVGEDREVGVYESLVNECGECGGIYGSSSCL